uniref:Uncharacterized protein n=2 Tax=Rhodnius prolixus TaxID=13249 RepID=A0A4P6D828_RHOPR
MKQILILLQIVAFTYAMDCSFGQSNNFIEKVVNECPRLIDSADKKYCCPDSEGSFYCCDLANFLLTGSLIILPIAAILLVVSFIISCICCFCCPFCCIYKRRNGRVFI